MRNVVFIFKNKNFIDFVLKDGNHDNMGQGILIQLSQFLQKQILGNIISLPSKLIFLSQKKIHGSTSRG